MEEDNKLYLSEMEIRQYEEAAWKLQKLNLEANLKQLEQKIHQLEMSNADLKIKLTTKEVGERQRLIKEHRKSHSEFNKKVGERLGLNPGARFAYDPFTGEIDVIEQGELHE
jgi:lipid II:glycine glycyltransferase (peptidoglycan interpeptide bridge formation enzyme)